MDGPRVGPRQANVPKQVLGMLRNAVLWEDTSALDLCAHYSYVLQRSLGQYSGSGPGRPRSQPLSGLPGSLQLVLDPSRAPARGLLPLADP